MKVTPDPAGPRSPTEGHLSVPGGRVWYRSVGSGDGVPLLLIHGGPGAGHDYLEPLERLADFGRRVVMWDQLGCGRSETSDEPSLYRLERQVEEVAAIRAALGLERVHLLGQSLGGWLAIEYLLSEPGGVVSLHLASTSSGVPALMRGLAALRRQLPVEVREALERGEARGEIDGDPYQAAELFFVRRHVCRLDPFPLPLQRTIENTARSPAYRIMWGSNQFLLTGNLRGWDRGSEVGRLRMPTLVSCGQHDKFVPACSRELHEAIPGSELNIFEHSSHMSHLEEPEPFIAVVEAFLARAEQAAQEPSSI
jgi:proline-specific peptidase